ncbi:LysR family transcriptional regulator [Streptomyces litchfieldiae]|uniref:LysR family transcriptional regulator n=1 Tax=Streptomyces litchfieldiae TaxID=3075543 RepID=A0ABU2MJN5_9ACTN|nr:LysR family transcriptional regulator [Streptomyces sp. DSM 44938]MDT0341652.1 LysR family transcriptional regulator [Streptomyces sp. DSM 44938]
MDPHLLRTFVTVARHGSFSAAARELGYTQSAVSQQIAALEADLRAPLLGRRPVVPTPAGARLLEHAGPLLLRVEAARADIARLVAAPRARLAVGVSALAQSPSLAGALAQTHRQHPGAEVTLRVLPGETVSALVATGELDLGLIDGAVAPTDPLHLPDVSPLTARAVAELPLAVALPAHHPLSARTGLRLHDLSDARWLDAPAAAVPLARLRAAAAADGFRPAVGYAGADPAGLLALVAAGHGLAVLPHATAETAPGVRAVPLAAPRLVHRVELIHSGPPTGPAADLAARLVA